MGFAYNLYKVLTPERIKTIYRRWKSVMALRFLDSVGYGHVYDTGLALSISRKWGGISRNTARIISLVI